MTAVDLRFARHTVEPADDLLLLFGATAPVGPPGPPISLGPGLLRAHCGAPWASTAARRAATGLGWSATAGTVRHADSTWWGATGRARMSTSTWWGATGQARMAAALPWADARTGRYLVQAPWGQGTPVRVEVSGSASQGTPVAHQWLLPWQAGRPIISWGGPWEQAPSIPPVPFTCRTPDPANALNLLFSRARTTSGPLLFSCRKPALVVVPIQEVYVVINSIALVRVSDGQNVPCSAMSLSLDVDTWAWGFSATLPGSSLALVEPATLGEPVVLDATVNGTTIRVLAESIETDRVFARKDVRISGRGLIALLESPYAPEQVFSNTADRTSQQILDDLLPVGWTATWDGVDPWLVQAGAWSHRGTVMSAATTIANAVGAYILPDPVLRTFKVRPRYPVGPWDWSTLTPDFSLPAAIMQREGIRWVDKPRYDRVWVSGTTAGVTARVTRLSMAGSTLAPMVTDALITHSDAARQRGLAVLSDVGRQAVVTQRLPVLGSTGILRPGHIVDYVDGAVTRRGIVRSVSVSVDGLAGVWQSVGIETNEG